MNLASYSGGDVYFYLEIYLSFFFSSGGHFLQQSRTFVAFLEWLNYYEKHFYEIILNLSQSVVQDRDIPIFSFGSHLLWPSKTICANLVKDIMCNIQVKIF